MKYPRPVRDVHQIEVTTRCNLRCHYCPHFPELPRKKEDMDQRTWEAALDLVRFYCRQGTQTELSLTGIGESLLHERFVEMVHEARAAIGPYRPLVLTTNGLELTEEICEAIKQAAPRIFVSLHRPEKAAFAVAAAKKAGILAGTNEAFATSSFDWAGHQKNWTPIRSAPKITCDYLHRGWCVVLVDGTVATCCLDATGASIVGSVWDNPEHLFLKPWGDDKVGCKGCHMETP